MNIYISLCHMISVREIGIFLAILWNISKVIWINLSKYLLRYLLSYPAKLEFQTSFNKKVSYWISNISNLNITFISVWLRFGCGLSKPVDAASIWSVSWSLALPCVLELLWLILQRRLELQLLRLFRRSTLRCCCCWCCCCCCCCPKTLRSLFNACDLRSSPALVSVSELLISAFTMLIIRANVTYQPEGE